MSYPNDTDCRNCGETPCGCPTPAQIAANRIVERGAHDARGRARIVCEEIIDERERQHRKWGEQNHPDGTGPKERTPGTMYDTNEQIAWHAKVRCDEAAKSGRCTYMHILNEEVREAFAESDPAKLRAELVQVAAVAVAWIEAIDRRTHHLAWLAAPATRDPEWRVGDTRRMDVDSLGLCDVTLRLTVPRDWGYLGEGDATDKHGRGWPVRIVAEWGDNGHVGFRAVHAPAR
jgi:hypothetical protein